MNEPGNVWSKILAVLFVQRKQDSSRLDARPSVVQVQLYDVQYLMITHNYRIVFCFSLTVLFFIA